MKIAILTTTYFPESNGASIRTEGIAEGLHAWGNEVIILVPGKDWRVEKTKHATVYHIPVKKSRLANFLEKYTKANSARYKAFMKYVPEVVEKENIDIIHTRQPLDLFMIGKNIKQQLRKIWVTEAHKLLSLTDYENGQISGKRYEFMREKEVTLINHSDVVVTMTKNGEETLQKMGVKKPIIAISNASSIQESKKEIFHFDKDKKYLLYAGSIREVEGVEELIAVFADIHRHLSETRLIIIGNGNIHKLKQLAKKADILNEVYFLGSVPFENIGYFYKKAALFIHMRPEITYHRDIIGLKFYDALKCGLPIVASDVGELGDWIKKEKFGMTFPSNHPELFKDTVIRLITNKKEYNECKRKAIKVGKNITWKNACKQLHEVYKEMVKEQ